MKWTIPAKTFLLGEYVALMGGPAIILTTSPHFELSLLDQPGLEGIHPKSPAGIWWQQSNYSKQYGLHWHDPYQQRGGLGASSAQFVGAYLAHLHLQQKPLEEKTLLDAYLQCAWQGEGTPPSGYDVLAQSLNFKSAVKLDLNCAEYRTPTNSGFFKLQGCAHIHQQKNIYQISSWPFQEIAFILLHTGKKLATHHHLQSLDLPNQIKPLESIVENARKAFESGNSMDLVDAINAYQQKLEQLNLVAEHSLKQLEILKQHSDVLAAKGCGAMGADILLLLVPMKKELTVRDYLSKQGLVYI